MTLALDLFLWAIVGALALAAAMRGRILVRGAAREGALDFLQLLPRIAVGVVGAGFIAAVLPQEMVATWLGPASGTVGVTLATIAGAFTPGGPVLGFSVGAAALKGGAGAPQVIAYSTAWALFALPRMFLYEFAVLPPRVVWLRILASLPLPFLAAAGAMLIGRP